MDVHVWLRGLGLDRYAEAFAANDVDGGVLRALGDDDLLKVPTPVMHGVDDHQVAFAAGRYIGERIPGAQLYPFEGRGHLPMTTATREFCDVVRRFVRAGTVGGALRPNSRAGEVEGRE